MKHHPLSAAVLVMAITIIWPSTVLAQEAIWRSYMDAGEKAANQGDFAAAERYFALAEKEAEGFPASDTRRAYTWNQLASACSRLFQYGRAEQLLKKSVALAGKGKEQVFAAHNETILANHYRLREKYDLAEPLYKKALAVREKVNGPDAWETAQLIRDLADLNRDAGRLDAAEALYKRSLKILEGKKDQEYHTAFCLANLGELRLRQSKAVEAEALCRQATAMYERLKSPSHLNEALCQGTLGESLRQQKKPAEAAEAFTKALSHLEAGHAVGVRTLPILVNAAKLYQEQGKTDKAQELEKQAAAIRDRHKKAVDGKS
jgi:hypothetical protein